MLLPPPPPHVVPPIHPTVVEQWFFDQDIQWHSSSVLSSQTSSVHIPDNKTIRLGFITIPASVDDETGVNELDTYKPYSESSLPISFDLSHELEDPILNEDWVFKPKPVSREQIEVHINVVREGSLKNLSLSPLEDFEY